MTSYMTSKSVIAVGAVLPGLATIAVALRFYGRRVSSVSLGMDDWLIFCCLVSSLHRSPRSLLIQPVLLQILTIGLGIMLIVGKSLTSTLPLQL